MLCELPSALDSELKALKSHDTLSLSTTDLHLQKDFLLSNSHQVLTDLETCLPKLLAFHNESLIAPIFRDVVRALDKLQTFLFLLFNEAFSKLPLEVLADLFIKLQRIGEALAQCKAVCPDDSPEYGSADTLLLTFFKYFYMNWEKELRALEKSVEPALLALKGKEKAANVGLGAGAYSDLEIGLKQMLKNRRPRALWKRVSEFMQRTFVTLKRLDSFFIKSIGKIHFLLSYFIFPAHNL